MTRRTNQSLLESVEAGGCAPPILCGPKRKSETAHRCKIAAACLPFVGCVVAGLYLIERTL